MLDRLRRVNTAKLSRRLEEVAIAIHVGHPGGVAGRRWRASGQRQTGCAAIQNAGQVYAAEQLHAVRIATKKLRYALELVADSRLAPVRPLVNTLKRAQETLGTCTTCR